MKLNPDIPTYGDTNYRGECPKEEAEQITFINWLRREYPDTFGALVVHVKNEGKRTAQQAALDRANGLTAGAADIQICATPAIVIEMKRRDHTKSHWQTGQQEFLLTAKKMGSFVGVALGAEGAKEAIRCYLKKYIPAT